MTRRFFSSVVVALAVSLCLSAGITSSASAQPIDTVTVFSENFEGVTHTFNAVNGTQTNQWRVASAIAGTGSRSAYISNDAGTSNAYTVTSASVVHLYRDVTFPVSEDDFRLAYSFRGMGDANDNLTVWLVETTVTPTAGTALTAGVYVGPFYGDTTWRNYYTPLPYTNSGTTKRIVFSWKNNASGGTQPPAAVDDISLTAYVGGPPVHVVTFNLNDGTGTVPTPIRVRQGSTIMAADMPSTANFTRTGFVNDGKWYTRVGIADHTYTEFIFGAGGTPVTENTTLYLQWQPSHIVTFNLNGGTGTAPASVSVVQGGTVSVAQRPSADGFRKSGAEFCYVSDGKWYTRAGIGENQTYTEFIFGDAGTPVIEPVTLYLQYEFDTALYDFEITGSGTVDDPYNIANAKQLAYLALMVNNGGAAPNGGTFAASHYKLTSDLDLSPYGANFNGGKGWLPIGKSTAAAHRFSGTFNGNAKKITGLYINDTSLNYAGLFGYVAANSCNFTDAYILLVGLENVNITAKNYVGAIAGYVAGNGTLACEPAAGVKNSYSSGKVSGGQNVGGITGYIGTWGYTTETYSIAAVTGSSIVGGIAGYTAGEVQNNLALNPSVVSSNNVGRVVGSNAGEWVGELAGNYAFAGILNASGNTTWANKGLAQRGGEDISIADINATPNLNGSFTEQFGFKIAAGSLPGFGAPVVMPPHLGGPQISVSYRGAARSALSAPRVTVRNRTLTIRPSSINSVSRVRLIDMRGKSVAKFNVGATVPGRPLSYSLTNIPAGRYFVEVREGVKRERVSVVVGGR